MRPRFYIFPRLFHFKQPAGTSRGIYTTRQSWLLCLVDEDKVDHTGWGECAPLPKLSCDDLPNYHELLFDACRQVEGQGLTLGDDDFRDYPSIRFGIETALRHFAVGSIDLWDTPFSRGEEGIVINGLVWMGTRDEMLRRIEEKLNAGFHCVKLKIGAIDFQQEIGLIEHIRRHFSAQEIELRVDANGAFTPENAPEKLARLAALNLHSIEQPIRAGQWEAMGRLTETSPLPIALDEELIGVNRLADKQRLLDTIKPQYIVLKPSLHGGFAGTKEWIDEAEKRHIGWWITSALESNIGLNAIAQFAATLPHTLPQGLGTGALFTNNITVPIEVRGERLWRVVR